MYCKYLCVVYSEHVIQWYIHSCITHVQYYRFILCAISPAVVVPTTLALEERVKGINKGNNIYSGTSLLGTPLRLS